MGGSQVPESSPLDSCRLEAIRAFAAKISEGKAQPGSDFTAPATADVEGTEFVYRRTKFNYLFRRSDSGVSIYEQEGILNQAGKDDRLRGKLLIYEPNGSILTASPKNWESKVGAIPGDLQAGSITFSLPPITDGDQ